MFSFILPVLNQIITFNHPKSSFIRLAFLSAPATPMFIELAAVTMLLPDEMEEPSEMSPPSRAASNLPLASIRFCFVGASDLWKFREGLKMVNKILVWQSDVIYKAQI